MFKNIFVRKFRKFWKKTKYVFPPKIQQSHELECKKFSPKFGVYDVVVPGCVSSRLPIPQSIQTPDYFQHGVVSTGDDLQEIEIKNNNQIERMRNSCRLASKILHESSQYLKVGLTTDYLDKLIHQLCIDNKAFPSPLNYRGFPKSVCTSVNNVACHGVPDDRPLKDGDIINIDITVFLDGYHGDCSKTFPVGNVDEKGMNLINATETVLQEAIDLCKPGTPFCAIGNLIEFKSRKMGFNVIPSLVGHGIGTYFHGPPDIYHCGNNYPGRMQPGMTFTIEPALTQGGEEIIILDDGWTAITADNARSAQCEHTILITRHGVEILTLPPE